MKNTLIFIALSSIGITSIAQTGTAQTATPTTITLLKKTASTPTPSLISDMTPSTAALNLPVPAATVTAKKVRAQELPGLGMMPGEAQDMRIKSVRVGTDRNELVYISQSQLNKISTPFDTPQIIDATGATLKAVGQDLFLRPASDQPFTVYITNGGVGQSIGLTLVPRANLPAQTIVLQPDTPTGAAAVKAESEDIVPSDYVSRINGLIKTLALGKTPSGFTRSRLPMSVSASADLVIEPQYKFAGSSYDLYSYKVRSISSAPLELKDEAFYTEAVRAVAFFPSAMLQTGEDTTVFIIADRPVKGSAQ